MPLTLNTKQKETKTRPEIEGERLLYHRLLLHDFDQGQPSSLTLGQPGSCKTAVDCSICEYFMRHHPEDKIFWRSALNAPLQIVKLPRWDLYIEKYSGIRFFDRKTGIDITDKLQSQNRLHVFSSFEELYHTAKPGICHGVFFRDMHHENIKKDEGTLRWFQYIRFLLNQFSWCHVFLDEYQEMVKSGNGDAMYWEIDRHSDDVSSARKTHVGVHANCHQTAEIDWRVLPSFMITIQLFGSRPYKYNMVNRQALANLKEPTEQYGTEGWIAEGGKFGRVCFNKVYKLRDINISPRIISMYEHTKVCPSCQRVFNYDRVDQVYCSRKCNEKARRQRKKQSHKEKQGETCTLTPQSRGIPTMS